MSDLGPQALGPEAKLGRREANKSEKRRRIRQAAHELFIENGYDGTTLRDIAARGEVGFGTLFDYASNKRDLLFLIFNPEFDQTLGEGCAAAGKETAFIDQLIALFQRFYRLYQREPAISRDVLRELNFFSDGAQARVFLAHRQTFFDRLTDLTANAQASGRLQTGAPAEIVSQLIFAVFAWEVRRWLAQADPEVEAGVAELRRLLAVQLAGFLTTA